MMTGGSSVFALLAALAISCSVGGALGRALEKRSAEFSTGLEYPGYEYQRVVPKRAALLLDRLLVALQKAVDNEEMGKEGYKTYVKSYPNYSDTPDSQRTVLSNERTMDLQRRGQAKGRVYWRCYLNAVTCFKRK